MSAAAAAASLARHLGALAAGLQAAADAVPGEVGFWSDPGRVLLLDMLGGSAERIRRTARVCATVARALAAHAEDLTRAELMHRTPVHGAEGVRVEADALVRAAGVRLRATVEPATRELPEPVHGPAALRSGLQGTAGSFLLGLLQATSAPLSAVRWLAEIPTDPAGHATQARQGLAAARRSVTDPHAWLSLLDLDTLRDDPARWAGGMAPAALGAVGGSTAARQLFRRQLLEREQHALVRGRTQTELVRLLSGARAAENRRTLSAEAAGRAPSTQVPWTGEGGRSLDARRLLATDRMRDLSAVQAVRLTSAMQGVAAENGLVLRGLETNVKGADSLRRKSADRFAKAGAGTTVAQTLAGLDDIVRFTFEAPPATYTDDVRRVTRQLEERGFRLNHVWNAWAAQQSSYRGVNTNWTMPNTGVQFELQFHTAASLQAVKRSHPYYEQQRLMKFRSREWKRLDEPIRAAFADVPEPVGIGDIPLKGYRPEARPAQVDRPPDLRVPAAAGAAAGTSAATGPEPRREAPR